MVQRGNRAQQSATCGEQGEGKGKLEHDDEALQKPLETRCADVRRVELQRAIGCDIAMKQHRNHTEEKDRDDGETDEQAESQGRKRQG